MPGNRRPNRRSIPANKLSYSKAAGADARERTLHTDVLGRFKSERGDNDISARRRAA